MMDKLIIANFDAKSNDLDLREMTNEEKVAYENDIERQNAILISDAEAKKNTLAKLEALGLNQSDLKVIGLA
jgi:hypothetical protein